MRSSQEKGHESGKHFARGAVFLKFVSREEKGWVPGGCFLSDRGLAGTILLAQTQFATAAGVKGVSPP
ncbi:hypothetical protein VT03_31770 [Planctomyces sp. SH-PL14]|nr:hypothetical protein VT03_31770 [Planctomyces sp. SH-PL14]